MRALAAALAGALPLAACAPAAPPLPVEPFVFDMEGSLPPGYPPELGTVEYALGGEPRSWRSYDFSIGAMDASAGLDGSMGEAAFRLVAYEPGTQRDDDPARLAIRGRLPSFPAPGPVEGATATLGTPAQGLAGEIEAVVESLSLEGDPIGTYGRMTGRFAGELCPAAPAGVPDPAACRAIEGRFDTRVQVSNLGD